MRRGLQEFIVHCGTKGAAAMAENELRRKLRAFPTGGLFFRLLTRF